jgi:hypothetical protein
LRARRNEIVDVCISDKVWGAVEAARMLKTQPESILGELGPWPDN